MGKYTLPLLGFLIDLAVAGALVALATPYAAPALGFDLTFAVQALAVLALVVVAAMLGLSPGSWALGPATAEREAGVEARQWPNLLLGLLGVSGAAFAAFDHAKTLAAPFLLMVEPTPMKLAVVTLYHAGLGWGGLMLLRFMPGARLVNLILLVVGAVAAVVNYLFSRDAMIVFLQASTRGRDTPLSPEAAESYMSYGLIYGIGLSVVMIAILWLCRERPRPATG